jgi:hypothetical protein
LWILVLISGAVYAADAFTAVNLLAFDKWSSQVKPQVPFNIAKWIFAITIILSYVFLAYRWVRAVRVIRTGGIAECYLEPLAAIWQSMRLTKQGQGWRRFLVFAELTRSRKGVDYIALFVYFQFKGALIVIVAQGPRIAINAMTLWAVMQANLIPTGEHAGDKHTSSFVQFFKNIEIMANENRQQTLVYFTMLFSFVIWAIAFLSLLVSVIFYVFFLWHHVPKSDGSLTAYCRRKIETRLERVVSKKIKKALEKQNRKRQQEERSGTAKGDGPRCPKLPSLDGPNDNASTFGVTRSDTFSTVATLPPPYSANAPTRTNTMTTNSTVATKHMNPKSRPFPGRADTDATYGSNVGLLGQAGDMGTATPLPPMPQLDRNAEYFNTPQNRSFTPNELAGRPYSPMTQGRASPRPPRNMLPSVNTNYEGRASPAPRAVSPLPTDLRAPLSMQQGNAPYPSGRPGVSPVGPNFAPYDNRGPGAGPAYEMSPVDASPEDNVLQYYASSNAGGNYASSNVGGNYASSNVGGNYASSNISSSYAPSAVPSALRVGPSAQTQQSSGPPRVGTAPPRAGTAPPSNPRAGLPAGLQSAIQRREALQPLPNQGMNSFAPQQRSATAPLRQPGWNPRAAGNTPSPAPQGYNNGPQGYNPY